MNTLCSYIIFRMKSLLSRRVVCNETGVRRRIQEQLDNIADQRSHAASPSNEHIAYEQRVYFT